jgi:putative transposase
LTSVSARFYTHLVARPIRIDYPDTFYHILSRGNERRNIFYNETDYLKFLDVLGEMVQKFHIEIHAYVLMPNHYHLLVRTTSANISRAIQWLGVSYSVWFNKKHTRSGHLFQGRFKSFLVENEKYLTAMGLYIHGNPLRAGLVEGLSRYRWSSYKGYINKKHQTAWLTTDLLLSMCGKNRKEFQKTQEQYVTQKSNILDDLYHGSYLGSEEYASECLSKLTEEYHTEKPQIKNLLKSADIRTIALNIFDKLGEKDPEPLFHAHRRTTRPNRDVAIYALSRLGVFTNKKISELFDVGYTAVTEAVKRGASYIATDDKIRAITDTIIIDK